MSRPLRSGKAGVSLVELMITIVLAVIVFAAMTPLFVNALKTTSRDSRRVIATNIAQARIERVRMLANVQYYGAITTANLNSGSYANGLFATSFTPAHGGAPYTITTTVSPTDDPAAAYKTVMVTVSRAGDNFQTKASTIVMNPAAVTTTSGSGPTNPNGPFSLTVAFKNWSDVTSSGVKVVYVKTSPTPQVTTTATPTKQVPSASSPTVTWTGLPGGANYLYTVTCYTQYSPYTEISPSFHLFSNGWMKFDTHPGG
jgi:Tfp pilus assembly protein PilV